MLDVLARLSQSQAAAALNAAVIQLTQDNSGEPPVDEVDSVLVHAVIVEIAQRTKTKVGEERHRFYQLKYVSDELSRMFLSAEASNAAAERLGARGELRPDLYKVKFPGGFDADLQPPRESVRSAIYKAESWQHFDPWFDSKDGEEPMSLFARSMRGGRTESPMTLLVLTLRNRNTLNVVRGLQVFHDDVRFADVSAPIDILRAFAETFGISFEIADRPRTKFLHATSIPLYSVQSDLSVVDIGNLYKFPADTLRYTLLNLVRVRKAPEGHRILDIGLSIVLDTERYETSLKRHGAVFSP